MESAPALGVRGGALVASRLFDVAYAIQLQQAEALWLAANPGPGSLRLRSILPRALSFEDVPLQVALGRVEVDVDGRPCAMDATATVYDFGVIACSLRREVTDLNWDDYGLALRELDARVGGDAEAAVWPELLERLCSVIAPAFERPTTRVLQEDYLYAIVHAFTEPLDADQLTSRVDIPQMLSGETRPLSLGEKRELMSRAQSYFADDLVVITWDRAFVYEPRRDAEVIGILEIANAQLVELRYYDELLDDELPTMYDMVEDTRAGLLSSRRASRLARKLHGLVAEVTEITERVENALQVTEDVYLARVYTAALELFRVPRLSAAVDRKLDIIRDTYTALYDEAHSRRAEVLEIAIVVLILFEVVMVLVKH